MKQKKTSKLLLVLSFFIIVNNGFAQKKSINATLDSMRFVDKKIYESYSTTPFTGNFVRYYSNGKLQFEIPYVDGIPVGQYKEWYIDGTLKLVGNYNNEGLENGEFRKWYENGIICFEGFYKNGECDSTWNFYSRIGVLMKKSFFRNGMKESTWQYWTDKGELNTIEEYRNDSLINEKKIIDYIPVEDTK
jgi:antitoxin component YwqK of YwqJK toxin-antitoxin module